MDILVKQLQQEDIGQIAQEVSQMWIKHSVQNPHILSQNSLQNTNVKGYFNDAISKGNMVFVAIVNNEVVGIVRVEECKLDDFFVETKAYYIDDLVVKESLRGKGVGRTLLTEIKKVAKTNGVKILKSRVYTFNKEAISLMERNNFENLYSEYFCIVD